MHHNKMFSQGKRNDILEHLRALENPEAASAADSTEPPADGAETDAGRTDEKIGAMYSLSRAHIARYLRIDKLNAPLKFMLDKGKFTLVVAVELSFLTNGSKKYSRSAWKRGLPSTLPKPPHCGIIQKWVCWTMIPLPAYSPGNPPPRRKISRAGLILKLMCTINILRANSQRKKSRV